MQPPTPPAPPPPQPAPPPTSPIKLMQQSAAEATNVASVTANFAGQNTAGNLLIAFVRMSTTSQTVTISDSAANAYTELIGQAQTADGSQIHVFYAKAKAGANRVTATFSASNGHPWLAVYEYSGVSTPDQKASFQGNTASPKVTVSGVANELVFVGAGLPASFTGNATVGSGFGLSQQDTGRSRAAIETATATANGTYSGGFTLSSSANSAVVAVTFK